MQTIFRMMNTESSLFKPERLAVLLDVMRTISQRVGPDIYFDFNGRNSVCIINYFTMDDKEKY